ncbi:DUF294 nucleotidyltransferase-like domain-containing protein [Brevibacillus dissolubilis]|uniref:DUF294 nucleotidyltransferase-like domain-containing protein n=1 Tax=Brevibacillus dissolubilis TaxID=1844116 RepID=UPI0011160925|nr:DUF294 nucleotidyltransferase-like domain-containing protein [Brevibacillus dissolubilis]
MDHIGQIEQITTYTELNLRRTEWLAPLQQNASTQEWSGAVYKVNLLHERMMQRSVQLAIEELEALGMGEPPVPYAFVVFGSAGRQEQSFVSDQDNGLIYEIPPHTGDTARAEIDAYFARLADVVVQGLADAGYPPCHGNVTCTNPRWRGSVEHWQQLFDEWQQDPTWENVRYLLVVGDARMLAGSLVLFSSWKERYHQLFQRSPMMVNRLLANTLHRHVPLGWFGRIQTELQGKHRGAINLKNGLYLPYVNCLRLWAIAHDIPATSSLQRLYLLRQDNAWPPEWYDDVEQHFRLILGWRLLAHTQWSQEDYEDASYLKLHLFDKNTRHNLKSAMKLAIRLQEFTQSRYQSRSR